MREAQKFPKTLRPSPHLGLALVFSQNLVPGWRELPGYGRSLGIPPPSGLARVWGAPLGPSGLWDKGADAGGESES